MTDSEEIVVDNEYEYNNGARVRRYPTKPNASFSTYYGSDGGSFASFSSLASGWGQVKQGEGASQAMYGQQRPELAMYNNANRRRAQRDEEEEERANCSLM